VVLALPCDYNNRALTRGKVVSKTRAVALAGVLALAFLAVSSLGVSADANPSNHGHHYGQLKHRAAPLPPPTVTPPTTNPAPPPAGGVAQKPTGTDNSVVLPPLEIKLILPHMPMGEVNIVRAVPERDSNLWWLLVVLVVTLGALWMFAAVQLGRASLKLRRGQVAA
jgi:hypothetical protein